MGNRFSFSYLAVAFAIMLALLSSSVVQAETGKVAIAWDSIDDPELGGYTVVWGQASRSYGGSQDCRRWDRSQHCARSWKDLLHGGPRLRQAGSPGELSEEVTALINGPDTVPPIVSGVSVGNISSSSAVIAFNTNEEAYVQLSTVRTVSWAASQGGSGCTRITQLPLRIFKCDHLQLPNDCERFVWEPSVVGSFDISYEGWGATARRGSERAYQFLQITLSNLSNTSVTINWTTDKVTTGPR